MIIWPLYRAVFGDRRLPVCKYSQESGWAQWRAGLSCPYEFACASAQSPVQGPEAVRLWESGVGALWVAFQECVRTDSPQAGRTPS